MKPSVFATFVFLAASSVQAEIETISVTSSRLSAVDDFRLSAEQIEALQVSSTISLIKLLPGVVVSQNGGPGGLAYVSVRGGDPNFTLVLVDGVAVNDSTNSRGGGFDFNQINPAMIERIELSSSSVSAVHGGDALSGVIHIITKSDVPPHLSLSIGNYGQRLASAGSSFAINERTQMSVSISHKRNKFSALDSAENLQMLTTLNYQSLTQKHQLSINLSDGEQTGFAEDSGGELFAKPAQAEHRTANQHLLSLKSTFDWFDDASVHLQLSSLEREESSLHPGIADGVLQGIPASDIQSNYERQNATVYIDWRSTDTQQYILGIDAKWTQGDNLGTLDFGFPLPVDFTLKQRSKSVFAEAHYVFDKIDVSLGARHENMQNFDNEQAYQATIRYQFDKQWQLYVKHNKGFKTPSFFALAHPLVGNPELQPERSRNNEVGVRRQIADGSIQFAVYDNRYTNLIDFDPVLFTNINRQALSAKGAELSVAQQFTPNFSTRANVAYNQLSDETGDVMLRRRPEVVGNVQLEYAFDDMLATLYAHVRSDVLDSSVATGERMLGGNTTFGAALNWTLSEQFNYHFSLENITGKNHQQAIGFINDQQLMSVGLNYQF